MQKDEESAWHYSVFGRGREGKGVTWALQLKAREAGDCLRWVLV